jgi:hypothetical protein
MLENRDETKEVRETLQPILKKLRKSKIIADDEDVISEYLYQLLKHTRAQLQEAQILDRSTTVEFVLCVPAVWSTTACLTMQAAMGNAVQRSGFLNLKEEPFDLFIVSEPEAAAAWVLAETINIPIYVSLRLYLPYIKRI